MHFPFFASTPWWLQNVLVVGHTLFSLGRGARLELAKHTFNHSFNSNNSISNSAKMNELVTPANHQDQEPYAIANAPIANCQMSMPTPTPMPMPMPIPCQCQCQSIPVWQWWQWQSMAKWQNAFINTGTTSLSETDCEEVPFVVRCCVLSCPENRPYYLSNCPTLPCMDCQIPNSKFQISKFQIPFASTGTYSYRYSIVGIVPTQYRYWPTE